MDIDKYNRIRYRGMCNFHTAIFLSIKKALVLVLENILEEIFLQELFLNEVRDSKF